MLSGMSLAISFKSILTFLSLAQRLLVPPDQISSFYSYSYCSLILFTPTGGSVCAITSTTTMDVLKFTPPFTYSYQCGSTLLTSYIPVYMYSITLQLTSIFIRILFILSSHLIKFPEWLIQKFVGVYWPLYWSSFHANSNSPPRMIESYQVISFTMSNLILLLSFGLCSPVLSLYITLSISVNLCCWLMLIGRFITMRQKYFTEGKEHPIDESCSRDEFLLRLDQQICMEGVQSSLFVSKWPIICTSSLFITLLCWDMVGDQVGWYEGLWVPFAGVAMIFMVWLWDRMLIRRVLDRYLQSCSKFIAPSPSFTSSNSHNVEFIPSAIHN
jgi:hypothetical protein